MAKRTPPCLSIASPSEGFSLVHACARGRGDLSGYRGASEDVQSRNLGSESNGRLGLSGVDANHAEKALVVKVFPMEQTRMVKLLADFVLEAKICDGRRSTKGNPSRSDLHSPRAPQCIAV